MPKKRFFIFQKHRGPRRGQPLHVHITLLFVTLVLVLGILLIGYNHLRNRQIILSASESLFQRIAQDVRTIFAATHEPAIVGVSLLTHTALVTAANLEERRRQLPLLAQLLAEQPYLSGIEVGYANGDFFILRPLRDATGRQRFQASANAEFVVDDISGEAPNDRVLTRLFLDGDLRQVDRRISKAPDYDPRTRPWYRLALAHAEPVLTRPYLYHFSREVGVTVARRAADHAVVAADLTLLERFTREARAFSGADVTGVMLLDEDRQRLLPRALQLPEDSAAVSPAPLSLDDPVAALLRKVLQDNTPWNGVVMRRNPAGSWI